MELERILRKESVEHAAQHPDDKFYYSQTYGSGEDGTQIVLHWAPNTAVSVETEDGAEVPPNLDVVQCIKGRKLDGKEYYFVTTARELGLGSLAVRGDTRDLFASRDEAIAGGLDLFKGSMVDVGHLINRGAMKPASNGFDKPCEEDLERGTRRMLAAIKKSNLLASKTRLVVRIPSPGALRTQPSVRPSCWTVASMLWGGRITSLLWRRDSTFSQSPRRSSAKPNTMISSRTS